MARLLQMIFVVCLVAWPVAWLKTDTLPNTLEFSRALAAEPRQTEAPEAPLDVAFADVAYRVEPSHRYALDGLVVSYKIHDADHLLHRIWNNHLITADAALRERIGNIAVGDQIHLEGYLASYSNASGFHRGSSTTRTDTGNGACETVYVTALDTLESPPRGWRKLSSASFWGMLLSGLFWLVGVAKGWL